LILKETTDIDDIKAILCNPEIYGRIASDSKDKLTVDTLPFNENYRYIAGYINDVVFGLCIYCKKQDITIVHFQVLPDYRKKYAKKFAMKSLDFRGTSPLFAVTPNCYQPVINFALHIGFEIYGVHDELFTKNGKSHQQTITRFKE
jgi:hypothetical protein